MSKPNVPRVCERCGAACLATAENIRAGGGRFCSRSCVARSRAKPPEVRFWRKVDKRGPMPGHVCLSSNCWQWRASITSAGYGKFGAARGRFIDAHRFSWQHHFGEVPSGLLVCHRCDNKLCVNPEHLFLGTHADNMRDMVEKGRAARSRRKCG